MSNYFYKNLSETEIVDVSYDWVRRIYCIMLLQRSAETDSGCKSFIDKSLGRAKADWQLEVRWVGIVRLSVTQILQ